MKSSWLGPITRVRSRCMSCIEHRDESRLHLSLSPRRHSPVLPYIYITSPPFQPHEMLILLKMEDCRIVKGRYNTESPFLAANLDVADDLSGAADTLPKSRPVPKVQKRSPRNPKAPLNAPRVSITCILRKTEEYQVQILKVVAYKNRFHT